MKDLSNKQIEFFTALKEIQDTVVNVSLCNKSDDIENMLYNATYETIYSILELFDGYTKESIKMEIVDIESGESISNGIQLHDVCVNFINYEKE